MCIDNFFLISKYDVEIRQQPKHAKVSLINERGKKNKI